MESLFGEAKPPLLGRRGRATTNDVAQSITPRTLLPWSVIQNSSNRTVSYNEMCRWVLNSSLILTQDAFLSGLRRYKPIKRRWIARM